MEIGRKQCLPLLILGLASLLVSTSLFAQQNHELLNKVMQNDIQAVKKLIASGADINQQNQMYGHTPLIIACNYNYVKLAKLLIAEGADVNMRGKDGSSALIAAAGNSQELVELLLSKGADIKAKMKDGTGVFTQCITGILMGRVSLPLAELLLSKGADVDDAATSGMTEGYTPLMMAARNDKMELVKFLIKHGANVNAKSKDGATPLSLAAKEGHQDIVDVLKKSGARN
ncbi:MAG: ankyrin repeat domain-containing protein [Acidobacteriota bacterium]